MCLWLQLNNTKSVDNSINLMHFLVKTIMDDYPELSKFVKDLSHVPRATKGTHLSVLMFSNI